MEDCSFLCMREGRAQCYCLACPRTDEMQGQVMPCRCTAGSLPSISLALTRHEHYIASSLSRLSPFLTLPGLLVHKRVWRFLHHDIFFFGTRLRRPPTNPKIRHVPSTIFSFYRSCSCWTLWYHHKGTMEEMASMRLFVFAHKETIVPFDSIFIHTRVSTALFSIPCS